MTILLDLDGTLTDTVHDRFEPYKTDKENTILADIAPYAGAVDFVNRLRAMGHNVFIITNSNRKYAETVRTLFGIEALPLADKPNKTKTVDFIRQKVGNISFPDDAIVIGDTSKDIMLGRALNCPTVWLTLYPFSYERRHDGAGDFSTALKSGATFRAHSYSEVLEILGNIYEHLYAIEAVISGSSSTRSIRIKKITFPDKFVAYRSLGRQQGGEADRHAVIAQYKELHDENRTKETLNDLSIAMTNYLDHVVTSYPQVQWDFITYVADKATTTPPNKMGEFFDLIKTPIKKEKLILWHPDVDGSIKTRKDRASRIEFVSKYTYLNQEQDLKGKNIIIVDDQYTTGGTAAAIVSKFHDAGAKNVLFVTLFYLITTVMSDKVCPRCGQTLERKTRKKDYKDFLSCTPPEFRGNGCGYAENIEE